MEAFSFKQERPITKFESPIIIQTLLHALVEGNQNFNIQLRAKQTAPLVNKHYENEVTLRQQN